MEKIIGQFLSTWFVLGFVICGIGLWIEEGHDSNHSTIIARIGGISMLISGVLGVIFMIWKV